MRIRHLAHEALDFDGAEVEQQKAGASLISICPSKMGISNGVVDQSFGDWKKSPGSRKVVPYTSSAGVQ